VGHSPYQSIKATTPEVYHAVSRERPNSASAATFSVFGLVQRSGTLSTSCAPFCPVPPRSISLLYCLCLMTWHHIDNCRLNPLNNQHSTHHGIKCRPTQRHVSRTERSKLQRYEPVVHFEISFPHQP